MAKILVTGGNGYIGSHTVVELLRCNYEVVIIDNLCNSKPYVKERIESITGKSVEFYQFDLTDRNETNAFFKNNRDIVGIIHFAAHLIVDESVSNPIKYYYNNLTSLLNVVEGAKHLLSHVNIVFSSSCTVYGNSATLPIREDETVKPAVSPYGNTKKICEEILFDACRAYDNFKAIALRYFNPVGAHNSGLLGEDPIGTHTHLFPIIAEVGLEKRKGLKVFGNDYPTQDGTCIRDYIHVTDLALAHIAALDRLIGNKNEKSFEAFNAGTGEGYSVLQIITAFEETTGIKIPYSIEPRRPGDAAAVFADTQMIERKLGWKSTIGLKDMVRSAFDWEKLKH